jgi:glycerol uptake facilitator-like aquaporin
MIFQVIGAFFGAFVAYFVFQQTLLDKAGGAVGTFFGVFTLYRLDTSTGLYYTTQLIIQAMLQQTIGAFLLVLMYLTQTDEKYKLS